MNKEQRAKVNVRIYQLTRKLEQLQYDAQICKDREQAKEILQQAREIELLIGY